jgi:hypothetical protein
MEYEALSNALGELFLAGEYGPAGVYRQIGRRNEIELSEPGFLPSGPDGQVPCYVYTRAGRRSGDRKPPLRLVEA